MSHRSSDFPSSPAHRHSIERTFSRDHTTSVSVSTGYATNLAPSVPQKRARSNSSSSTHTAPINIDRSKPKDRNTWPGGPPPTNVQRTSLSLQRSPSTAGRNQSQTNLQPLYRSVSNSSSTPSHIQRSHSNQPSPTLTRRYSRSSPHSPTQTRSRILFYHKHQPYYGFTNFSNHPVEFEGKKYPTSEHLFQSLKVCTLIHSAFHPSDSADLVHSSSIIGRTYPHMW